MTTLVKPPARLPDWQLRFEQFVMQRLAAEFVWGRNDCGLFAADAVRAITGVDLASHLRAHTDARGALVAVRGYGGIANLASACLGPAAPAVQACVGDVVLLPMGKRLALGICNGATAIGPGPSGLAHVPMVDALMCWRLA